MLDINFQVFQTRAANMWVTYLRREMWQEILILTLKLQGEKHKTKNGFEVFETCHKSDKSVLCRWHFYICSIGLDRRFAENGSKFWPSKSCQLSIGHDLAIINTIIKRIWTSFKIVLANFDTWTNNILEEKLQESLWSVIS